MESTITSLLEDIGLDDDEARAYQSLLELGQSPVTSIAQLARINRTSCYNVLESLVQKKLAHKSQKKGKIVYSASDPAQLIENLEQEKKKLDLTIEKARVYQQEMKKRFAAQRKKPIIRYVEGKAGIIELYEDSLRCENKEEGIMAYTSLRDLREELGEYPDQYFAERTRRCIPIRSMVPDTPYGKEVKQLEKEFLREVRLLPKEVYDFSPEIYLYDNKFSVMSFRERFGFLLESKEIVDALKIAWQLAWEKAKEYDSQITV